MQIDVTADLIARGVRGNPYCCPAALAIFKALGGDPLVVVDRFSIHVQDARGMMTVPSPPDVARFVKDFDTGQAVAPFSFTLPDPGAKS